MGPCPAVILNAVTTGVWSIVGYLLTSIEFTLYLVNSIFECNWCAVICHTIFRKISTNQFPLFAIKTDAFKSWIYSENNISFIVIPSVIFIFFVFRYYFFYYVDTCILFKKIIKIFYPVKISARRIDYCFYICTVGAAWNILPDKVFWCPVCPPAAKGSGRFLVRCNNSAYRYGYFNSAFRAFLLLGFVPFRRTAGDICLLVF